LARDLAEHFHAPCVAEYARHYLEQKGEHSYDLADLETIARQQVAQIQRALSANPKVLFCDTDLVTLHIWSLDKFDQTIPFVEEQLQQQKADLYLLCKPEHSLATRPAARRCYQARGALQLEHVGATRNRCPNC
jgi:nicotinamide riboside kinase